MNNILFAQFWVFSIDKQIQITYTSRETLHYKFKLESKFNNWNDALRKKHTPWTVGCRLWKGGNATLCAL